MIKRFIYSFLVLACIQMLSISDARAMGLVLTDQPSVEDCDGAGNQASCTVLTSSVLAIPPKGAPYKNTCETPHDPGEVGLRSVGGKSAKTFIIGSINIADRVFVGIKPAPPLHARKTSTRTNTRSYVYVVLESCVTTAVPNQNQIVTQIIRIPYNGKLPKPTVEKRFNAAAP